MTQGQHIPSPIPPAPGRRLLLSLAGTLHPPMHTQSHLSLTQGQHIPSPIPPASGRRLLLGLAGTIILPCSHIHAFCIWPFAYSKGHLPRVAPILPRVYLFLFFSFLVNLELLLHDFLGGLERRRP